MNWGGKMLSILIVDDEEYMRDYLASLEWRKIGFDEVKIASNGTEALNFLEQVNGKIDVLLTDIRMPFLDGLELCRIVSERFPFIYKLILTGYDEFEYAQKAIKYGVKEYILKPIIPNEMYEIMEKVKRQLLAEKEKLNYLKQLEEMFENSKPILKERFILRILKGNMNLKEIQQKAKLYGIDLEGLSFTVAILTITSEAGESLSFNSEIVSFALYDVAKKEIDLKKLYITTDSDNSVLLLFVDYESAKIKHVLQKISNKIKEVLNVSTFASIGKEVNDITQINTSYRTALSGLKYRFLDEDVQIIEYKDFIDESPEEADFIDYNYELEKLIWEIKLGNPNSIENEIEYLFEKVKKVGKVEMMKLIAIDIIVEMFKLYSAVVGKSSSLTAYVDRLEKKEINVNEVRKLCLNLATDINQKIQDRIKSKHFRVIEQVKNIIKSKFSDPSLSLNNVATELHISMNYLSSLFKKETGQSFTQYLTNFRIDKAKELLKTTDLKTYEIAYEVGYDDPQYFSTVFKKIVGVSPSEYREMIKK